MRKLLAAIALMVVSTFGVMAQGTLTDNSEVYVGYQFVRVNPNFREPSFRFDRTTDAHGVNASLTGYLGDTPVGVTGELAANFEGGRADNSLVTAMAGLTLKARNNKSFQPFVRGLVGGARLRATNQQLNNFFDRSDVGLAFAAGAGLDIKVDDHVSLRVIQADYLQTRFFGQPVHNLRLGAGIVF